MTIYYTIYMLKEVSISETNTKKKHITDIISCFLKLKEGWLIFLLKKCVDKFLLYNPTNLFFSYSS